MLAVRQGEYLTYFSQVDKVNAAYGKSRDAFRGLAVQFKLRLVAGYQPLRVAAAIGLVID